MTKEELQSYFKTHKDICKDKIRLSNLEAASTNTSSNLTGMPHGGKSDKTSLGAEIAELKMQIEKKQEQRDIEFCKLKDYIGSIDDCLIKQALSLKYVTRHKVSWIWVAMELGGNNNQDSVRMMCERHLTKH